MTNLEDFLISLIQGASFFISLGYILRMIYNRNSVGYFIPKIIGLIIINAVVLNIQTIIDTVKAF